MNNSDDVTEELDIDFSIEFFEELQAIALTLEQLVFEGEGKLDLEDIVFPQLRQLSFEWGGINAPQLNELNLWDTSIDLSQLLQVCPNIETLTMEQTTISNTHLLSQFPLTHLSLNDVMYDEPINIDSTMVTTLVLIRTDIEGVLPSTLKHLTWDQPDARMRHLTLRTLTVKVQASQSLPECGLSRLTKLTLTNVELDDSFFIDGPVLTELILTGCSVSYTDRIKAPILTVVVLTECQCTNFLPRTIIDLTLHEVTGDITAVGSLVNLKQLNIKQTLVEMQQFQYLNLVSLSIAGMPVSDLRYLRHMHTLKRLKLRYGTNVTDAMIQDIADLNVTVLRV